MHSVITSIGTSNPEFEYNQDQIFRFMADALGLSGKEETRLKALYKATGIKKRYSVLEDYKLAQNAFRFYPQDRELEPFPGTKQRMELYKKEAIKLALKSSHDCLGKKQVGPESITHLITVSCTGMYAPGLDIDLVNQLGLNSSIDRTAINFMGCYAAITGLKQANSICLSNPKAKVLLVCVELCSLHFQKGTEPDTLLANALFSDGAASVLIESGDQYTGLALEAFHCDIMPDGSKDMAWELGDFGFEMKLSAYVPALIEKGIVDLTNKLKQKLHYKNELLYAIHPGGKKILEVIENALGINKKENHLAYEVLKSYGNMSSPTILFVLNQILEDLPKYKNKKVLSFAFGPGLTLEAMMTSVKT